METRKRWQVIAVAILLMSMTLFFVSGVNETVYAAGNTTKATNTAGDKTEAIDVGEEAKNAVTENYDDKEIAKDLNRCKDLLGLDIEDVGTVGRIRHIVAGALAAAANILFSGQVLATYGSVTFLNFASNMNWLDSLADKLGTWMDNTLGGMFNFSDSNSPIFYLIFFAMVGVVISLAKMRVSEGFGKFIKILVIVCLCMFLLGNSAKVFSDLNKMSNDISDSFTMASSGGKNYVAVWDINAIRPWKILQFGDMGFGGKELDKAENNGGVAGTSVGDGVDNVDWSSLNKKKNKRERWLSITPANQPIVTGILGKQAKSKGDGGKMYQLLSLKPSDRDDVATAIADLDKGRFELSTGVQGGRVGAAFMMLILSLPLTIFTLAISVILIALKLAAIIMFYTWPIAIIWAMATNNFDAIKKWLISVATFFLLGIVVKFLFSIILAITMQVHSDNVTFGYWCVGSILVVVLFAGGYFVFPKIMEIFGGYRPNLPFTNKQGLKELWAASQLRDIKSAVSGTNDNAQGNGNDKNNGENKHDKMVGPGENEDNEEVQDENEEQNGEMDAPEEQNDSFEDEDEQDESSSTEGMQAPEDDDGLGDDNDNRTVMGAPEQDSHDEGAGAQSSTPTYEQPKSDTSDEKQHADSTQFADNDDKHISSESEQKPIEKEQRKPVEENKGKEESKPAPPPPKTSMKQAQTERQNDAQERKHAERMKAEGKTAFTKARKEEMHKAKGQLGDARRETVRSANTTLDDRRRAAAQKVDDAHRESNNRWQTDNHAAKVEKRRRAIERESSQESNDFGVKQRKFK